MHVVLKTTSKVYGKGRTLAPRQPETSYPIVAKFDTRDYVLGLYKQTKLGRDPSMGFFSPHTRNIQYTPYVRMFTTLFCFF